ncbi:hypothetical protein [uncultured Sphingomonas sp.]|uniref:hypothetical protein n=1 Tax=uncultured Sphingomonas sp. TaxID=158754 RepID=UPI0025CF368E|nr:hypothetical protein [uncultured Sphingomonas sp.]
MSDRRKQAQEEADRLHEEEEHEKAIAAQLPPGKEQDEHRMRGERLSDKAWSIEEAEDIDPRPSGSWPEPTTKP